MKNEQITSEDSSEIKCFLSAKGWPYAIISSTDSENASERTELRHLYNEQYYDATMHEYVLEEYHFSANKDEIPLQAIMDFYLIDSQTMEVTAEKINT